MSYCKTDIRGWFARLILLTLAASPVLADEVPLMVLEGTASGPYDNGDFMGFEAEAAKAYNVMGVPNNYLVDSGTGEIVAKDLRQHKLDEKLEELLDWALSRGEFIQALGENCSTTSSDFSRKRDCRRGGTTGQAVSVRPKRR